MTGLRNILARFAAMLLLATITGSLSSCIQPPLRLPAQELKIDVEARVTNMELVWGIDVDWEKDWYYGWDDQDTKIFGPIGYPEPQSYEVRRYFLGEKPHVKHSQVDAFTIEDPHFRRNYMFGYYDILLWSNIRNAQDEQTVVIDEKDLDQVTASTTISRSINLKGADEKPTALFNQPDVFYSTYPRDIYISRNTSDYDYYDENEKVWVKKIHSELTPLVYIYLVQIVVLNNNGIVRGTNGNCAISAFAPGTVVNDGHTFYAPCLVYFGSRMKKDLDYNGKKVDIIGAKFTTYGLCDMEGYHFGASPQYSGSRADLPNYLYYDLELASGKVVSMNALITEQCQAQSHGGIITVVIDAKDIVDSGGEGSAFNPTVDDYENLEFEIPM